MREYRFNVFGKPVAVRATDGGWAAFYLGAEGKRRPADFVVPPDIDADGLRGWLADLFHEEATPRHPEVDVLS
jgi:hypothetical protein